MASYVSVTWTTGDTMTEAKLDNMVSNDTAEDAHPSFILAEIAAPSSPSANEIHIFAADDSGTTVLKYKDSGGTVTQLGESPDTFGFTVAGTLSADTDVAPTVIVSRALTIEKAYAYVKTQPTGASIICDINKNGTTIWSTQGNRVTISAASNLGTQTSFNTTSLADEDLLTLDIDQVGSSVAGADLTVELRAS